MTDQTTLDRMREGIFIAMPAGKGVYSQPTVNGIINATIGLNNDHIPFAVSCPTNMTMICIGRSDIVNIFLHNYPEFQWLLFIDDDMGFNYSDIVALFEANEKFIGAAAPKRELQQTGFNFQLFQAGEAGAKHNIIKKDRTAIQASSVGTGFLLLHRSIFTKIAEKFPELEYTPLPYRGIATDKKCYHYFKPLHEGLTVFSEDISFCKRYAEAGGEIWLSLKTNITHSGMHEFKFPEPIAKILKLGV